MHVYIQYMLHSKKVLGSNQLVEYVEFSSYNLSANDYLAVKNSV